VVELCSHSTRDVLRCKKTERSVFVCEKQVPVLQLYVNILQFSKMSLDCCDCIAFCRNFILTVKTNTKGTMDSAGSARNSCNSWPLYGC